MSAAAAFDGIVDFHNHVIPAVDDGAQNVEEALTALRRMRAAGVTRIVATPHIDGSLTRQPTAYEARIAEVDAAWETLSAAVASGGAALPAIQRGAEIKLDTPDPDLADERLRLAGTDFVLLEFPFMSVPPRSAHAIRGVRAQGFVPIVAHPERYHGIDRMTHLFEEWRSAGAYLQVNCGSLLGRYGPVARQVAAGLLRRGHIDYLASDHHARGPMPYEECVLLLEKLGAAPQADLLLRVNADRLLQNAAPLPARPLPDRSRLWSRISNAFR